MNALHSFVYGIVNHIAVLAPAGSIALKERNLLVLIGGLSMLIVVPVFVLTIYVAWKYREGNTKAKHNPNWDYKPAVDVIWWTIPTLLIIVISVIIWQSTKGLDPFKPIPSQNPPLIVQVIAMDWKWLFIYPKQGIATVNVLEIPENTPVDFQITSDAPMNSFWIPELGSQMYAMPSMTTQLHLIASSTGTYEGMSSNISGAGFSGMTFTVNSVSQTDFNIWSQNVSESNNPLTVDGYNLLAKPSSNNPEASYSSVDPDMYDKIMAKDMMQADAVATATETMPSMPGMDMN